MANKIRGRSGYDHNPEFMVRALKLYVSGICAKEIARRLGKEYPGLCRQTISGIIKKHNWEKIRDNAIKLKFDGVEDRERILRDLKIVYDKLLKIIQGPDYNHQYFAQFAKVVDQIKEIEGWGLKPGDGAIALSSDPQMQAWLESVQEDPVAGKTYKTRKKEIEKIYKEKLKKIIGI